MEIEVVKISDLENDPRNARKHNSQNIDAIKKSLKKFGQQKPIVVDKNNVVIAGNGTLVAAKKLRWKEIEVTRTELEGAEATAFAIADNRTAELAEWDESLLQEQLRELNESLEDIDISDVGFDAAELGLDKEPEYDEEKQDDVPQVEENKYGVKRGDIYLFDPYFECENGHRVEYSKDIKDGDTCPHCA